MGALCVAAELAHLLIRKVHQRVAAVAGGQNKGHLLALLSRAFQHLVNGPLRPAGAGAHRDQGLGHDLLAVGQHDALGSRGTDVNS